MKLNELLEFNHIVIQCHDNPDADAIASGYGIYSYLRANGRQARLIYGGREPVKKSNLTLMVEMLDIPIEYVGLRPGEKLYEEKLMEEEGMKTTPNHLIHIGSPIPFDTDRFLVQLRELMDASYGEEGDIRQLVAEVVGTYRPFRETM